MFVQDFALFKNVLWHISFMDQNIFDLQIAR